MGRRGLERSLEADRSDCGAANAPVCTGRGERTRHVCRERSRTETALGTVRVAMGRYSCVGLPSRDARGRTLRSQSTQAFLRSAGTSSALVLSITLGKAEFDQAPVASRRERIGLGDEATGRIARCR